MFPDRSSSLALALAFSRLALGMVLGALILTLADPRMRPRPFLKRKTLLAIATLALGLSLFALFFGLIAGCDRL